MATPSIAILTMSTRPIRVGPSIGSFVHSLLSLLSPSQGEEEEEEVTLSPLDLSSFSLPLFNESVLPKLLLPGSGSGTSLLSQPESRAWSAAMNSHQGYVFVIPEYNAGMAGATKNAIDYLYHEISGKPAAVVSYGGGGGRNANKSMRTTLEAMGVEVVEPAAELTFARMEGEGGPGPGREVIGAATKGELGEATKQKWEKGENGGKELKEAFERVRERVLEIAAKKGEEEEEALA